MRERWTLAVTRADAPPAFHLLAKPTGAVCNLDCSYCYPCPSFKLFFHHVQEPMRAMAELLAADRPPAEIMHAYATRDARRGRNDPCSCGSGRKWKHCHGDSSPATVPPGT